MAPSFGALCPKRLSFDRIIGYRVRYPITPEEIAMVLAKGVSQLWTRRRILAINRHSGYSGVGAGSAI
jgi:hypothetical protein